MRSSIDNWLQVVKAFKAANEQLTAALQLAGQPINLNEFYALHILSQHSGEDLRISDIGQALNLSVSATSRMLAKFENNCHVIKRQPSSQDKRAVQVTLTPEGEQWLKAAEVAIQPLLVADQAHLQQLLQAD